MVAWHCYKSVNVTSQKLDVEPIIFLTQKFIVMFLYIYNELC